MAIARDLSQGQIAFKLVGGDAEQFQVTRYRGTEGLCQFYRFEVELVCYEQDLDISKVVGVQATFEISSRFGERVFHGIVTRFENIGASNDWSLYRAELMPSHWLLTHRSDCRIFQDKSVKDIVGAVMTAAGIPTNRYRFDVERQPTARPYCVQYRETDWNFIARLLEEEGIWWRFEHTADKHELIMSDAPSKYGTIGAEALLYRPPTGMNVTEGEHVFRFRMGQTVRPGTVSLADYNFENPTLGLGAKAQLEHDKGLEFRDYPGEYIEKAEGDRIAGVRTQEFESGRVIGTGMADCIRFAPGKTFELSEFPAASANIKWLLTTVTHQGKQVGSQGNVDLMGQSGLLDPGVRTGLMVAQQSDNEQIREVARAILQIGARLSRRDPAAQRAVATWLYHAGQVVRDLTSVASGMGAELAKALSLPNLFGDNGGFSFVDYEPPTYECQFECVPDTVSFRPPRVTPWPVMRGTQTARVVGPSEEEIHVDKYGRIKVQFFWDRLGNNDDKSSCFIRVAQPLAGGMYGAVFIPRVGQEVIVDFLEGDPDKPMVIGSVYNADNMPPYTLPDNKTRTVIKTNSSKGGGGTNEIRIEDLKDSEQFLINAQKDYHLRVGKDDKGEERHHVETNRFLNVKKEQRSKIGSSYSIDVGAKYAIKVKETYNETVEGDVVQDYKANHGHKVASEYFVKADKVIVDATSAISLNCGSNFVLIDTSGVTITGTMVKINSGGSKQSGSANQSPASPAAPEEPDTVTPGKDPSYSGAPEEGPAIEDKPYEGHWISFDLKDRNTGEPRAGEYYEVKAPSGKIISGTLDVNGFARVWIEEAGNCEISYPRLPADEWQPG